MEHQNATNGANLTDEQETLVHAFLYLLSKLGGRASMHRLFKILYFAEQKHIAKWGTGITNQDYIKMQFGPVPSYPYDQLKCIRDGQTLQKSIFDGFIEIKGTYDVVSDLSPDLDCLSRSEIEALDESILENKGLSYTALSEKSHDKAWNAADNNRQMNRKEIAVAGGASEGMVNYYLNHLESIGASYK